MTAYTAKLEKSGRIVIPADCRAALGLRPGDQVVLRLEDGELRLLSRKQALRRAQALVRSASGGASLSQMLIAERRAEAKRG